MRRRPEAIPLALLLAHMTMMVPEVRAQQLVAQPFATGLSFPTAFVGDPTAPNRHFVVEKIGRIRVLVDGVVQATPFLDLTAAIVDGPERGLLGLALDPDYATNRRFYVFFTRAGNPALCPTPPAAPGPACEVGDLVVARFRRSVGDPLTAEPGSRFDLKWISLGGQGYIEHSQFSNHNGGSLMFGPDDYLYIGIGDGGSSYDPFNSGQNPNSLLGKMLRIDVDVPDGNMQGYQVPGDNPFVDDNPIDAYPEIWAFGMRNPWKFSFDDPSRGGTGALIIGDVGQDRYEEVDYEPAGMGGRNYGWGIREGTHANPNPPTMTPAFQPLREPVLEYSQAVGETELQGASVIGGFVYRGNDLSAMWRGRYFFGDFASRRVWSAQVAPGTGAFSNIIDHSGTMGLITVSSFGVDQRGELYIVQYGGTNQGAVHRVCEITVTRGLTTFSAAGGTGTLRIETQAGCNWSLTNVAPWITLLSGSTGTGPGMVVFRVAPNPSAARQTDIITAGLGISISQSNRPAVHGDIDNSGGADLLWQHTDGRLAAWLMNGTMLMDGRPLGPGPLMDPDWQIVASGDFDRDGSLDVIFQHQTDGRLAIWLMSGTTLLSGMALSPGQVPDTQWKIRAAADMDRDGWMDLIWQHEGTGDVAVWLMMGTSLRDGRLVGPRVTDLNWRIVGAADALDDGFADIMWQHQTTGMRATWVMNGVSFLSGYAFAGVSDTNWKIRAVTDVNGDRELDLVWQNQATGLLSVWLMINESRIGDGLRLTPPAVSDTNWRIVGPR